MNGLIEQVAMLGFLSSNHQRTSVNVSRGHLSQWSTSPLFCSITQVDHNGISDGFACLNTFPSTTSTLNTAREVLHPQRRRKDSRSGSPPLVALEAAPSASPVPDAAESTVNKSGRIMQRRHVAHRCREDALQKALRVRVSQ
jgi:hypothetical protein